MVLLVYVECRYANVVFEVVLGQKLYNGLASCLLNFFFLHFMVCFKYCSLFLFLFQQIDTLLACGGLAKNSLFIQEHADIIGRVSPLPLSDIFLDLIVFASWRTKYFGLLFPIGWDKYDLTGSLELYPQSNIYHKLKPHYFDFIPWRFWWLSRLSYYFASGKWVRALRCSNSRSGCC